MQRWGCADAELARPAPGGASELQAEVARLWQALARAHQCTCVALEEVELQRLKCLEIIAPWWAEEPLLLEALEELALDSRRVEASAAGWRYTQRILSFRLRASGASVRAPDRRLGRGGPPRSADMRRPLRAYRR